jgi:hypothetical protein
LLQVGGPVLVALLLAVLLGGSQHHDEGNFLLVDHAPEVFGGGGEGALRCNEELIVVPNCRVYIIGVDVGVVNVLIALEESHARVLDCGKLGEGRETYRALNQSTG